MEKTFFRKHNPTVTVIFLTMLAPTILMNLTTALASFADTVIIGFFLDDKSLSVVTYATPIYMIINTFAALFAVGGSIAMSVDSGRGDKSASCKSFSLSVELLLLIGMALCFAGVFFSDAVTVWLGAERDVFNAVKEYSTIIMIGAPVFMLNVGLAFFVRNDGRPVLSMVGMFLSIIMNIIFDIVFIGPLKLGVAGAAYATVLGQLVSVIVISTHFLSGKNTLAFRFNLGANVLRIIKNGSSTALHFVYQFLTILILNHFVSKMAGTNGVVVYTVVFNLYTVSLAMFEGISQTIQPMVSTYYGEKSFVKIKDTLRLSFIAIIIICGAITVALEVFPEIVPLIFGILDPKLLSSAASAVRIFSLSMIIMTLNVVVGYYLQSTEKSIMSGILVSLRCFVVFLICVFILGKLFGLNGIWAAYFAAEIVTFLIYIFMTAIVRLKLLKKGIKTDFFLLDTNVAKSITSYIFECHRTDYVDFKKVVLHAVAEMFGDDSAEKNDTCAYLSELWKCNNKARRKYIELELVGTEKKIIIYDNLNHSSSENIPECIIHGSTTDYGPVLGWNRITIE